MKVLLTGSAGHLGEALVRSFRATGDQPVGIDLPDSSVSMRRLSWRGTFRHAWTSMPVDTGICRSG